MKDCAEYRLTIPKPSDEQLLALKGLASTFGWQVSEFTDPELQTLKEGDVVGEELPLTIEPIAYGTRLILKDETDTVFESDTPEEDERIEQKTAIIEESKAIVELYNSVFDTKVPSVDTNTRTFIRKKVKTGEEGATRWSYTSINGKPSLIHTYELNYSQGEKVNTTRNVSMDIRTEKENAKGYWKNMGVVPTLYIGFDNEGNIESIDLKSMEAGKEVLARILQGTTLSEIIDRQSFPLEKRGDDISISVSIPEGILCVKQKLGYGSNRTSEGYQEPTIISQYRVGEAKEGSIERFTSNDESINAVGKERGMKLGSTITVDEYLQVIREMLALIPTSISK